MKIDKTTLVSDVVAENYKSASIFKKYNIDFCCNGNRTIGSVCDHHVVDPNHLIQELEDCFTKSEKDTNDHQSWDIGFLSDYIYHNHHQYVEARIPEIKQYLNKICQVHGRQHPELHEINQLFMDGAAELITHMKKEELILFPYFKKLAEALKNGTSAASPQFDTVQSPIAIMHEEHDHEGARFRKIAALSNNYTPPENACNTYRVTFEMLSAFEEDLHKHIHLENNILFKKAITIENTLKTNTQ